jgi:hypothetical protein
MGCGASNAASLQEPKVKAGPRFELPSGPSVANPPRRIADASDAGVTLGFLQQFFKQVRAQHLSIEGHAARTLAFQSFGGHGLALGIELLKEERVSLSFGETYTASRL